MKINPIEVLFNIHGFRNISHWMQHHGIEKEFIEEYGVSVEDYIDAEEDDSTYCFDAENFDEFWSELNTTDNPISQSVAWQIYSDYSSEKNRLPLLTVDEITVKVEDHLSPQLIEYHPHFAEMAVHFIIFSLVDSPFCVRACQQSLDEWELDSGVLAGRTINSHKCGVK